MLVNSKLEVSWLDDEVTEISVMEILSLLLPPELTVSAGSLAEAITGPVIEANQSGRVSGPDGIVRGQEPLPSQQGVKPVEGHGHGRGCRLFSTVTLTFNERTTQPGHLETH